MLNSLPREIVQALRLTIVFAVVTGLVYGVGMTGLIQVLFHDQANGSLIMRNGQIVGSTLIGQSFSADKYFQGRYSANGYAADNSAGSNLGPSNQSLIDRVASSARAARQANGLGPNDQVPVDLVTGDFSGFDPNISEASALLQVNRVAQARNLDPAKVRALIEKHVHGRILWLFGEQYVNVLEVNLALDAGEAG
ncbi:MAG TPA: K(+)-transporting ATPase subunit C [Candidatus Sulfotelmatobacter sp.]|nr:K(+)-transporting ATPase subunit C [Candidatus Sulfotelmatobacter sp.]